VKKKGTKNINKRGGEDQKKEKEAKLKTGLVEKRGEHNQSH